VSYWAFEESSGTRYDSVLTSAKDLSEIGAVTGSAAGMNGDAANFVAGSGSYFQNLTSIVDWYDAWSLAGWAKRSATSSTRILIAWPNTLYQLYHRSTGPGVRSTFAGTTLTKNLDVTSWHHIILTWDGVDTVSLYVNADAGTSGTASPADLIDGIYVADGDNDGLMDEWGVWSRVLTSQERADLYNGGAGVFY
jgi:hypothetical protein